MAKTDIIEKLKQNGLAGRGGAEFPVWQKWQAVKNAKNTPKYIVCNASEGEPLVFKDRYILENYPDEVVNGIKIALSAITPSFAYIYLNKDYFQLFKKTLTELIGDSPIKLFEKPNGYIAGEETSLLNVIEGKPAEPRLKPPYPTEAGLWGKPTLINNVETFYWVSKTDKGEYKGNRFYCINGDPSASSGQAPPNPGVFELPESLTIKQVLEQTANYQLPATKYFYQIGGGAVGTVMLDSELNQPMKGTSSIIVFDKAKTDIWQLMRKWAEFFHKNNCDQCAPCREGLYRIFEIMSQDKEKVLSEKSKLNDILEALEKTALCPLGRMAAAPFKTAIAKIL
ncbi:MAG: hypothetical protein M1127_02115 [Patescibacteria group bacterium]|nr:hypothetical protein [Patescibacteria group bacterium]